MFRQVPIRTRLLLLTIVSSVVTLGVTFLLYQRISGTTKELVASGTLAVPTVKNHLVPGSSAGRTAEWFTPCSPSAWRVIRVIDSPKKTRVPVGTSVLQRITA